ncbi:hypothetical protein D8B26_008301 [Coccidioides posadasii str. Silveira]|uniref:Uncharacterized protein n=1 Tax=Coccidioides posadasii (strain RMSCC 757 / Silveira) TaxID=443226 RepID=E9DGU1_COCPS|nr:conserved hypothetical protein [Coccidioides posadasii str. Silveira]QVM13695.1 hypothetical protein D8B26_008301 [Coccidioides posadasii str. Silveira]
MNIAEIVAMHGTNSDHQAPHSAQGPIPRDTFPIFHPYPLSLIDIPWHPHHSAGGGSSSSSAAAAAASNQHQHPDLALFLRYVLDQGREWMTARMPWARSGDKSAPARPSKARVQVCSYVSRYLPYKESAENRGPSVDHWFGRRSVHEDVARRGSATLAELRGLLKDDHAENEVRYNPGVIGVERVTAYDLSKVDVGGGWKDVTACVNTITHKYPMCTTRCYAVLEITATLPTPSSPTPSPPVPDETHRISEPPAGSTKDPGFITIQIPLDPSELPESERPPRKNCIFANYISIEMVQPLLARLSEDAVKSAAGLADGGGGGSGASNPLQQIEWTMATSAHAGGWIPEAVQRSWSLGGVPKQIVKDVEFVMGYLAKRREEGERGG